MKSGLTGRTVLLPTDDVNEYANFLAGFGRDLKPVGQAESELVQIIVDCFWRLRRLQALEYALHVHAHEQFADAFPDCPAEDRYSKILLQSCMTYEKHLRNCHIQEARLERKRIKAMNELQRLQAERKENEPSSQNQSAGEELAAASPTTRAKEEVEANGFVFSNAHEPAHSAALDRPITNWKAA